jgi:hypothetical protein
MNLMEYVQSNPTAYGDPFGQSRFKFTAGGVILAAAWELGFLTGTTIMDAAFHFPTYNYQLVKRFADGAAGFGIAAAWSQFGNILTGKGARFVAPIVFLMAVDFGELTTMLWAIESGVF